MAVYHISVCHDCKESVMWSKTTDEQAKIWHNRFHIGHKTELGTDLDDDFYYSICRYKTVNEKDYEDI